MKEVNHKQLTSNAFVNKLLLLNTQFEDSVDMGKSEFKPRFKKISMFLKQEFDNKRLTKDEIVYLLDNYFRVLDHLLELQEDSVLFLISLDYYLESLVKHYSTEAHAELARKGVRLNIFWQHADPKVRIEVAKHGYRLDRLIDDPHWSVREQVATHGYGLYRLLHDKNAIVRDRVRFHLLMQGYDFVVDRQLT